MAAWSARRHPVDDLSDLERLPPPSRPAVVLFAHAGFSHGHLARCHKIARALVREAPVDAYVVSSFPEFVAGEEVEGVHEVLFPGFGLAHPESPPERFPIVERSSPLPSISVAELSAHRGRLLRGLVSRLAPRAVHLEGFPFVRPVQAVEECEPTLAFLRAESPATLRCGGFNGVPIAAFLGNHVPLVARMVRETLDVLFVYIGEDERAALYRACPWIEGLARKVRFVGYVEAAAPEPAAPAREILATFGGGVDAYRKIVLVCEAFREFTARRPGWALHVVTGGQFPDATYGEVAGRYEQPGSVRVTRFVPGLARQLNRYALVISMGGYNTLTELYQASTRSIVLPRVGPDFLEQVDQARKFQGFGAVDHLVDADGTSPAGLAELMERALAASPAVRRPLALGGADTAARVLARKLG